MKTSGDVNFDTKFDTLRNKVYGTPKGLIRNTLVWEDIQEWLGLLFDGNTYTPKRILDAGCGTGEISRKLYPLGHHLTRIDISGKMLDEARHLDRENRINNGIRHLHESVQEHCMQNKNAYDIIFCHGMLAWLEKPEEGIESLSAMLKPGGYMSLLFYNRDRNILRNGVLANFYCLRTGDYHPRQRGGGLTPINPLRESEILPLFKEQNVHVERKSGIRIFFGLAKNDAEFEGKEEHLLNTERLFYRTEPFASIGVHTHLLLRKH